MIYNFSYFLLKILMNARTSPMNATQRLPVVRLMVRLLVLAKRDIQEMVENAQVGFLNRNHCMNFPL